MQSESYLTISACVLGLGLAFQSPDASAGGYKKPNVIIFMADDLGQDVVPLYNPDDSELVQMRRDLGNPFPENAPMPALEKLARQGVAFKNAWAMPVCSTTRGARSTGKYPSTTGVGQVIGFFTPRFGAAGSRFDGQEFPPSMLNPDNRHFLQRLAKKQGYRTFKQGKWHEVEVDIDVNDPASPDPLDLTDPDAAILATQGLDDVRRSGFNQYYGLLSGLYGGINGNGYGGGEVPFALQMDGAKLDDGVTDAIHLIDSRSPRLKNPVPDARNPTTEFADSAMVGRAIQLIKKAKMAGKPYFMEYSALAPHFQYEVPPGPGAPCPIDFTGDCASDWRTLDSDIHANIIQQIREAFDDPATAGLDPYPPPGTRAPRGNDASSEAKRRAAFKGLVSYMDVQMARLMEHVDWKNTYVMFVGDNGTQGGGAAFNVIEPPNDRFRSKASVYRNGREVPFVFAGPGWVKNKWRNDLVNVTDLYATVLEIIGRTQPKATRGSSFSFYKVLKGGKGPRTVNISELWPATPTVGGTNQNGTCVPNNVDCFAGNFGFGARAVGNKRFSLLAFNRIDENSLFVCRGGTLPEDDCLDKETGIYKHEVDLEFYDLKKDAFEEDALVIEEMSNKQRENFLSLCKQLNQISKRATYYQNGKVCKLNGDNLVDTEPVVPGAIEGPSDQGSQFQDFDEDGSPIDLNET